MRNVSLSLFINIRNLFVNFEQPNNFKTQNRSWFESGISFLHVRSHEFLFVGFELVEFPTVIDRCFSSSPNLYIQSF